MHSQLTNKQASRVGGRRGRDISGLPQAKQEEIEKRREVNRLAAARCRQRVVGKIQSLSDQVEQLQQENAEKQEEVRQVSTEVEHLKSLLQQHRQSGCAVPSPSEVNAQLHSLEAPATPDNLDSTMPLPVKTEPEDPGYEYAYAIPVETYDGAIPVETEADPESNEEDWFFFVEFLNQYGSAPSQSNTALAFGNSEASSSNPSNEFETYTI